MLDWYHFYLNHPGSSILDKIIREVYYWKVLVIQEELYADPFKICQQFKNRKTLHGHLPPNNIAELKTWNAVHVNLIGLYSKSIRQHQTGNNIIKNNVSLTFMNMINTYTVWFEIFKVLMYEINVVMGVNDEYIDNSYATISQIFNNT